MRKRTRSVTPLLVLLATLTVSMIVAHSAGGGIEGKVTDPKGAAVAGASVTITTEGNPQRFTGVTDHEGHYKVEGLPAGTYTVVISAPGFNDARSEEHTSELQSLTNLVCRLLLEKKKNKYNDEYICDHRQ